MVKKGPLKQVTLSHERSRNQIKRMKEKLNRKFKKNSFNGMFWNRKLTSSKNLARLGLSIDPNADKEKVEELVESIPEEQRDSIPVGEETRSVWNYVVEPQERMNIEDMLAKHGRDFKKMAMDIKLNVYQFTPKQLEKRIAKYDRYMIILAKIEEEKKKKQGTKPGPTQETKKLAEQVEEDEEAKEQKAYQDAMYLGRRPGRYKLQNGKVVRNMVGEKKKKQIRWF
jgi:hypothetical protein